MTERTKRAETMHMTKRTKRAETIEKIRKAVLSAASLLQDDPQVSDDTLDFLEADIRCAVNALSDLELGQS
jgi:hypothetical protein